MACLLFKGKIFDINFFILTTLVNTGYKYNMVTLEINLFLSGSNCWWTGIFPRVCIKYNPTKFSWTPWLYLWCLPFILEFFWIHEWKIISILLYSFHSVTVRVCIAYLLFQLLCIVCLSLCFSLFCLFSKFFLSPQIFSFLTLRFIGVCPEPL